MLNKNITRIDLEVTGEGIQRKIWYQGWREGDAPATVDTLDDPLFQILLEMDKTEHFSVTQFGSNRAQCLRGQITRMDFMQLPAGVNVRKFPYGWTASTRPMTDETKMDFDLDGALTWCKDHGYTVRNFPGGARAFLGIPLPIRDRSTILKMRRQIEQRLTPTGDNAQFYDLAFDF